LFRWSLFLSCLILAGCSAAFHIRDNLAEGQILEPSITRKPSLDRVGGVIPKYDSYLEGYITGGVVDPKGRAIQGVQVRVVDVNGNEITDFKPGVTDEEGIFKVRFSVLILWNRVKFTGTYIVDSPWAVNAPSSQFEIRYNGKIGTLSYFAKPIWLPVQNVDSPKPVIEKVKPLTNQQKTLDDFSGDFGFGD